jgi:peptidoglycan hydrolase-like protein with peptidoglycan-binding domain
MKNLFIINEEEKNRILNLHETATKHHYLSEQQTTEYVIQLTESNLKKTIEKVLLREDVESLLDMKNFPLGKVEAVQQALIDAGYDVGPTGVDGIYGKYTRGAVIKYQKDNGIKQTGNVGPVTSKRLGVQQLTSGKPSVKNNTNVQKQKKTDVDKIKLADKNKVNKTNKKVIVSSKINPKFKSILDTSKLSTNKSVPIFPAGQDNCAQFVREFINGLPSPGDAWIAHDNSRLGDTVWSSFTNLPSGERNNIINLWKKIDKKGGGAERGPYMTQAKSIVDNLVPNTPSSNLQLNDIVGIYYPGSKHHEEAFYQGGKIFFKKDANGNPIAGNTIKGGTGWGMNTHIGVVAAIDNGVPIVFHNIGGQVFADPYNNIKGGSRIAWVKRA